MGAIKNANLNNHNNSHNSRMSSRARGVPKTIVCLVAGMLGTSASTMIFVAWFHAFGESQLALYDYGGFNTEIGMVTKSKDFFVAKARALQQPFGLAKQQHSGKGQQPDDANRKDVKTTKQVIDYERGTDNRASKERDVDNRASKEREAFMRKSQYSNPKLAHPPPKGPPINFLTMSQLDLKDTFSASWIQRREEFLRMDLDKVQICEDAAFKAWEFRPELIRMTADYLDFCVEHLSKWWKLMTIHKTVCAFNTIMTTLQNYLRKGGDYATPSHPILENTLVMIAFQPYDHKKTHDEHYMLTVSNLAATIESCRRAQMGRVVVVGMADYSGIAQDAFEYMLENVPNLTRETHETQIVKVGHMEVTYVHAPAGDGKTRFLEQNIPRAALIGVRKALELSLKTGNTRQENEFVKSWLGEERYPSFWKYLYLTEPDTLLQTRPTTLVHLKEQLDQGRIVAPHRLQPIPHESDLPDLKNTFRRLNYDNGFDNVYQLDPNNNHDVCCDAYEGPHIKPGKTNFTDCGNWWYTCGFDVDYYTAKEDPHKRLRPYQLMKLKTGTGLTLIAGTLMARRCFPAVNGYCEPPPATEAPLALPGQSRGMKSSIVHSPAEKLELKQPKEHPQTLEMLDSRNPSHVYFMDFSQLDLQDTFSASWLQRKEEFMGMDFDSIETCEDAALKAWEHRRGKLRMTYDYLDLSVEYLSQWWKLLNVYGTPAAYYPLMTALNEYVKNGTNFSPRATPVLKNALAMIAFQPYDDPGAHEKKYNLSVRSLAATIDSIRRAQMGRVVIVGTARNGAKYAQDAFQYLVDNNENLRLNYELDNTDQIVRIGHMEVAYVEGSGEHGGAQFLEKNIPRMAIFGVRDALLLVEKTKRTPKEDGYMNAWLGKDQDPSHWKYFYLTESHSLLQARPASLSQLEHQLDQGKILAPHRLQPIPHESDVPGIGNKLRFLNMEDGFDEVWELDPLNDHDVCCDAYEGPGGHPGKKNFFDCGNFWYTCGFNIDYKKADDDPHKRLRPYQLMKLKHGSGLTLIAGTPAARRCFPAQHTSCRPPDIHSERSM